jgi:hypothetical protein
MSEVVTCARWGATDPSGVAPPTWSMQTGRRGAEWLCEACTRENVRNIEGKLDSEWW